LSSRSRLKSVRRPRTRRDVRNPIAVKSLGPDIPAPWTIAAYRAGRDPAIDAVVVALRQMQ
jgi:hypothetical protein